jgi:HSP20 family molecular chaperone IbpA
MSTEMTSNSSSIERAPQRQEQGGETTRGAVLYRPVADIVEGKEGVLVQIEMPGVRSEDVEISVERRVLTVRGRGRVTAPEGFRLVYSEYGEGDYERAFTLSQDIDEGRIAAAMKNGVLTLTLPRAEAAKPRKIEVKAA